MEDGDETAIMPQYDKIEVQTTDELIEQMNTKALSGYLPVWPSHKPLLFQNDSYFMIIEYHEPVDTDEATEIKAQFSELILEAEFQVAKAHGELEEAKTDLNFKTNWVEASKEEKYENPIKTVGDKASYIADKTKDKQEWHDSCKRWLAHLKRLEKIRVLPETLSPWEQKLKDKQKVEYPENSLEMSGIRYCGDDMKQNCDLCLECENKESE